MSSPTLVIRLGGLAGILAGLLYFVGYAGMAELLLPAMSNLGGHVVLGLAGMATLPAFVGVLARNTGRGARLGAVGYTLSFIGAAVFSVGNLAEGVFAVEFGVVLFGVVLMILRVGHGGARLRCEAREGVAGLGRVTARRRLGGLPTGSQQPCRLRFRLFRAVVVGCRNVGHWVGGGGLRALVRQ